MTAHSRPGPEVELVAAAWRRVAIQTSAAFAIVLLSVCAVAGLLVLRTQTRDELRQLDQAIADPNRLTGPAPGIQVYQLRDGRITTSGQGSGGQGTPGQGTGASAPDPAALSRVAGGGAAVTREMHTGGTEVLVRTVRRDGVAIQAVLDLTTRENERHRLYLGLLVAASGGMVLSLLIGGWTARRAIAPLGQALSRQRRFVADASHELRTPLSQLSTRAQLLDRELRGGADPQQLRADAAALVRGARQLGEVIDDLLLTAELAEQPQQSGPVDLGRLAGEVVAAEQPRAGELGVELAVHDPGGQVVRGSEPPLRRVLGALLDNALGHTPRGGHITVELFPDGLFVRCAVRDDGVGFGAADGDRLFERFARGGHGAGRRFGIGLSLVREVVVAHGGTVAADGRPGGGAVFTVRLPAWRGEPLGGNGRQGPDSSGNED